MLSRAIIEPEAVMFGLEVSPETRGWPASGLQKFVADPKTTAKDPTMSSNLTPASEVQPGSTVWVSDLTAAGRAGLDRFLAEHARHYNGHPTELDRWINHGILDKFAEQVNQGDTISFTLGRDASKDGEEHVFAPSPADVLCEALQNPF